MKALIMILLMIPCLGIGGAAVNFDGVDDYIVMQNDASLNDWAEQTISLWIKITTIPQTFTRIIEKGANNEWTMSLNYASASGLLNVQHIGAHTRFISSSGRVDDGLWHYIAVTISSSYYIKLYIDGVIDGEGQDNPPGFTKDGTIYLGRYGGGGYFFDGTMCNIQIYSKVLTKQEIERIYTSKNAWYPKEGLVSRWTMQGNGVSSGQPYANGSTVKDSAGSNNGTIRDGADNSMTLKPSPTRKKRGRR